METYSYSRLTHFEECPLSYMREYLNGEVPASHGVTESGTFMHNVMEKYFKGELKKDELVDYFMANFNKEVPSSMTLQMTDTFSKDMYSLYYQGYLKYLQEFEGIPNCHEIVDIEKWFEVPHKDFIINGRIDLIYRDKDNNLFVLDHKSKSKFKSKKDKAQYARQLYLYAMATKMLYGEYPKQLVFNLMRGDFVFIDFDEKELEKTLAWVEKTVEDIRDVITYDANPDTFFCRNWCGLSPCELCHK